MNHKILTGFHEREKDAEAFAFEAQKCKFYLEFGSGTTTAYVDRFTNAKAFVVENDVRWVDHVKKQLTRSEDIKFVHVDLGPCGGWGYPLQVDNYRSKFREYYESVWNLENSFDLVLVDGRFRVSTFLHSLVKSKVGTTILFDDYKNRDYYHVIEEIIKPVEIYQEMAKFLKSSEIDEVKCEALVKTYSEDLR